MHLNELNLNRLRSFYAVYRHKGIRNAARVLHVTPAAASVSIRTLEQELGLQLFTRVGHEMVPTKSAAVLYETVAQFFVNLDETLTNLAGDAREIRGTVRVGAPNGFGAQTLVPIARAFQKRHRAVRMVLRFGTPDRMLSLLTSDEIDMAIVPRPYRDTTGPVVSSKLPFDYERVLVCSREMFCQHLRNRPSYETVVGLQHISLWQGADRIHGWYRHHFRKTAQVAIVAELDNIFAAVAAVRHGSCVALLPSDVIAEHVESGELVVVFPNLRERKNSYYLIQLKDRVPYLVEKEFLDFLKSGDAQRDGE